MGWECHWVWRNVCFSYRHFTCPVTPCPPRARLIFGKAATRTGPLCGGFALGRCCPVLVAALPLWAIRGQKLLCHGRRRRKNCGLFVAGRVTDLLAPSSVTLAVFGTKLGGADSLPACSNAKPAVSADGQETIKLAPE